MRSSSGRLRRTLARASLVAAPIVLALGTLSCSSGGDGKVPTADARSSPTSEPSAGRPSAAGHAVRSCEEGSVRPIRSAADVPNKGHGLIVGDVLLRGFHDLRRQDLATYRLPDATGRRVVVYAVKAPVSVSGDEPVRLTVTGTTGPVRLAYGEALFPRLSRGELGLADLPSSITFEPCPSPSGQPRLTDYLGGIIMARPGCIAFQSPSQAPRHTVGPSVGLLHCRDEGPNPLGPG